MTRAWRAPLVVAAPLSLAWGVWLGLLRLGWILPLPRPDQLILHGPLMIGGFLGTLIGLERAIGVARTWAYAAPLASGAGALLLISGAPGPAGALLITTASAVVTTVFVTVMRLQPTLSAATMLAGSAAWLAGNVQWTLGAAIYRIVFWWIAFLVLTIAGERLELNRLLRPSGAVRATFVTACAVLVGGISMTAAAPAIGVRVAGAGLLAVSGWLAANDIARRTIRQPGLTHYIAICLLSGYGWLAIGGAIAVALPTFDPGPIHDAILHAVFLGFAMSMVFGHAPIVFPAVSGRPLPYRWTFYVPLAALHASLVVRLAGDLVDELGRWRAWGGLGNALSIALFAINVMWMMLRGTVAVKNT